MKKKNENKKKVVAITSSIVIALSALGGLIYNRYKRYIYPNPTPTPHTSSLDISKDNTPTISITESPTPTKEESYEESSEMESSSIDSSISESSIVEVTPTITIKPTNTPTNAPTANPTPKPTPTKTVTPTPALNSLEEYQEDMISFMDKEIGSPSWPNWFIMSYGEDYSYAQYKMDNPSLDWKTVIFHVNMGYNYAPYTRMIRNNNVGYINYGDKHTYFGKHILPYDYEKTEINTLYTKNEETLEIRPEAKPELEKLISDARKAGYSVEIIRTLLTYDQQKEIYDIKVSQMGKTNAEKYFPRPAHWDAQTGSIATLNSDVLSEWQSGGKNYNLRLWLENNAHNYGFILRYSKGDPKYTGYEYSWWDIRYIGKTEALKFKNQNLSYEEFVHRNYFWFGCQKHFKATKIKT